jgi:O-antigen/teichoic acid export membrane protein
MLVVLAKLGSAQMVGRFALGLAVGGPVMMFTNLRLRALQVTDARAEYSFWDYFSLRLITNAFALCVIAAIAALGGYGLEAALVILIIGLAKGVEGVSDTVHGLFQKHERLDLVAISRMIKGPLSLAAIWGLVYLSGSIVWGVIGLLAAWILVLLTYETYSARRVLYLKPDPIHAEDKGLRIRLQVLGGLAWLALPLGVVGLLASLNVNVPRYLVEQRLGEAALGYYAAMAYIMVAGNMVVEALTGSASPRLARAHVTDPSAFRRLLWMLLVLGAALGGAGVLLALILGGPLLALLYRPDYAQHVNVFVWLMAAAGIGYVARVLVCGMTASRQLKAQAPLHAITLLATAVFSWVLIPRYGLLGAAWAVCAGMAVLLVGAATVTLSKPRTGVNREDSVLTEADATTGLSSEEI